MSENESMDQDQWEDFRSTVIEQVTKELDRMKPIVENMGPIEATFHGQFNVSGTGHYRTGTGVGPTPLFPDDEAED